MASKSSFGNCYNSIDTRCLGITTHLQRQMSHYERCNRSTCHFCRLWESNVISCDSSVWYLPNGIVVFSSGAQDLDGLALQTARACGGAHTLLDPQKRPLIKSTMLYRDEPLPFQEPIDPFLDGEVSGRDGHLNKGKAEGLPPLIQ